MVRLRFRIRPLSKYVESGQIEQIQNASLQVIEWIMQNTSHAVMAQRAELKNSLDDFPTPPWATRALTEHVVIGKSALSSMTCLEPACGRGHMSVTLAHYFRKVTSFDVFDYGFGGTADFLKHTHAERAFDWV